jgi:Xaa-Pro aminopeptidase
VTVGESVVRRVAVVADDLIWGSRIADQLRSIGVEPVSVRDPSAFESGVVAGAFSAVIIDLTARAYAGLELVGRAAAAGLPVLVVGQHDDRDGRRAALEAGADRVVAYRKLFDDAPAVLSSWLAADATPGGPAASGTAPAARPSIPPQRYTERLERAAAAAAERGLDAVLVGVGPDLVFLTGYEAMPLERLTMLVLVPGRPARLVVPRLERSAAEAGAHGGAAIETWQETDDPYAIVVRDIDPLRPAGRGARVAVNDRLWATHLLQLQAALPTARFELATPALRDLRMRKDDAEVELLRRAAQAADRVVAAIAAGPLVGRTEADVAAEVRERLVAEGHDRAEFWIVASGPNSASPHHDPSDRVIRPGEPIVIDIGGSLGGYCSDITRTIWVTGGDLTTGPDAEFVRLYEVLQGAQDEATGAVRPGVACERVDAVARGIIEAAGFGESFLHRTGHGIGLEGHEEPYVVAGNALPLAPGMAFSVEPGIYLEGRYGARIEDIVVCGETGPIVLNEAPRDLLVVDG